MTIYAEVAGTGRVIAKSLRTRRTQATMEKDTSQLFAREGSLILERLAQQQSIFPEARLREDLQSVLSGIVGEVELLISPALLLIIHTGNTAALEQGITSTATMLSVKSAFGVKSERAQGWLTGHAAEMVSDINETTRNEMATVVRHAMENDWSYNQTAKEIKARFSQFAVGQPQRHIESRAHLVAVTEVGNAYEQGSLMFAEELQNEGLTMEKYWHNVGDNHVSDGCQQNTADGWIPLDELHSSGDMKPLRFPGCRCVEQYQRAKSRR